MCHTIRNRKNDDTINFEKIIWMTIKIILVQNQLAASW